jgi:hypothetical protein
VGWLGLGGVNHSPVLVLTGSEWDFFLAGRFSFHANLISNSGACGALPEFDLVAADINSVQRTRLVGFLSQEPHVPEQFLRGEVVAGLSSRVPWVAR